MLQKKKLATINPAIIGKYYITPVFLYDTNSTVNLAYVIPIPDGSINIINMETTQIEWVGCLQKARTCITIM